nr:hypothetical protein [Nitrobacter vulgaris]
MNGWLQLDLMHAEADGRDMIDPFELRERALLHAPGVFIDSVDLTRTPEHSYVAWVRHRAEREPDDTPFSVIILDPVFRAGAGAPHAGKFLAADSRGDHGVRLCPALSIVAEPDRNLAIRNRGSDMDGGLTEIRQCSIFFIGSSS